MVVKFSQDHNSLICSLEYEVLKIEPWGRDGVRVRATRLRAIKEDWPHALLESGDYRPEIEIRDTAASLRNGAILVNVDSRGALTFSNAHTGEELLKEKPIHALSVPARHYNDLQGDLFQIDACFEAYEAEHLYGLGQHQHNRLDQKGCVIELDSAQYRGQYSVLALQSGLWFPLEQSCDWSSGTGLQRNALGG